MVRVQSRSYGLCFTICELSGTLASGYLDGAKFRGLPAIGHFRGRGRFTLLCVRSSHPSRKPFSSFARCFARRLK